MNLDSSSALVTGKGITMPEALGMGGQTVAIGMGIVFGVLVILMLVLLIFGVIFHKKPKKADATIESSDTAAAEPVEAAAMPEEDEEELIAVLTAAVAASLNTSTYNLQIKSYRRVPTKRPAWNNAGLRETIGNRL